MTMQNNDYQPVLPCVVCGDPEHEGYFDHDNGRLLEACCPNKDCPDVRDRIIRAIKAAERVEHKGE